MGFKDYVPTYKFSAKLPSDGREISFQPMKFNQLKSLLTLIDSDEVEEIENGLDEILKGSILDDLDIDSLYLQDRMFLLLEIRKKSKGTERQKQIKCKKCKSQFIHNFNLDELKIKKLSKKLNHIVKLTTDLSVEIDFPTRKDQIELYEYLKMIENELAKQLEDDPDNKSLKFKAKHFGKIKEIEAGQFFITSSIKSIISPDGEEKDLSNEDKIFLIESLTDDQISLIGDWLNNNTFGIQYKMEINCPHCKEKTELEVGLADFF